MSSSFEAHDDLEPANCRRFIHVSIMIFVGFGFLMTCLKRYSNSAVALNFFTSCLVRHNLLLRLAQHRSALADYRNAGGAARVCFITPSSAAHLQVPLRHVPSAPR